VVLVPASAKVSVPTVRGDGVAGDAVGDIVKVGTIQRAVDLLAPLQRAIGMEQGRNPARASRASQLVEPDPARADTVGAAKGAISGPSDGPPSARARRV